MMHTPWALAITVLVVGFTSSTTNRSASGDDFRPLLSAGKLSAWRGRPHLDPRTEDQWDAAARGARQAEWDREIQQHWHVVPATDSAPAEIVSDGEGVFLTTRDVYGDFEFLVEWKMCVPRADSGVYLRGSPQVQIWDPADPEAQPHGADRGSGGLWNNEAAGKWPLTRADRPVGDWNELRIVMVGARVWVWLNDQPTVVGAVLENYWDRKLPIFPRGCLQLQTHGGEMRFRRPAIREIGAEEADQWLRHLRDIPWEPLFNGRDLSGWSGPIEGCRVEEDSLVSGAGTVYTERTFEDFDLWVEFQLPPGGNNGLAIRYPGTGDGAYDGMCELQILDNDHPDYRTLDPRQYHGSAYGMVAAHRGYLRPAGQWNSQFVRVRGSTIAVELNGTPILDADLAAVGNFLDDRPHPGRDRRAGHIGLCGHDSPVRFRRLDVHVRSRP